VPRENATRGPIEAVFVQHLLDRAEIDRLVGRKEKLDAIETPRFDLDE
jgi:hypothetical protein